MVISKGWAQYSWLSRRQLRLVYPTPLRVPGLLAGVKEAVDKQNAELTRQAKGGEGDAARSAEMQQRLSTLPGKIKAIEAEAGPGAAARGSGSGEESDDEGAMVDIDSGALLMIIE